MNKKLLTLIKLLIFAAMIISSLPARSQAGDEKYRQAIESADEYFSKGDYLNAKASYQVASQLAPDQQYPKDRMKESIELLRKQLELKSIYDEKVSYADKLYGEGSYENAIRAYEEAAKVMPSQEYPGKQISLIREAMAREAEDRKQYDELISRGDALYASESYQEARLKYEEASDLLPGRQEAADKLKDVDNKLEEIAAQQTGYEKAISEAAMYHARKDYENELLAYEEAARLMPDEPLPQIKISELNDFLRKYEAYNKFVTEGDELYIAQRYAEARTSYEKALEILPGENYPREIISKINTALSEKTEKDKAAYEEAIARADTLYNQENYDAAMLAYSDALRYWPEGEHARARLGNISEIMALRKAQEEAYANTITLADKHFAGKDYEAAKAEYRKAIDINPFEQYPKVRIDEIDMILAEIRSQLEQYEAVIAGADKLFNVGDYAEARTQYLRAQEIFSDRKYPADQISMIDEILGREKATREAYLAAIARGNEHFDAREWEEAKVDYVEANDLIPEEPYPGQKIAEINGILSRLKAEKETYQLTLKTADQLFAAGNLRGALAEYRKATAMFSDEEYPRQKIDEISGLLDEQERLAGIESDYQEAIDSGDSLMQEEKFSEARNAYERARSLKVGEVYPKEKIDDIEAILAERARQAGIEESYAQALALADTLLKEQKYEEARAAYLDASAIKPSEKYPSLKISEIDGILADLAKQEEEYMTAVNTADEYFKQQQYPEAREAYNRALSIRKDAPYPAVRIEEIDNIVAELAQNQALEEAYANALALGDNHLANKEYAAARQEYDRALELKPAEAYPAEKIREIDGILAEQARLLEVEQAYTAAIEEAKQYFDSKQYREARSSYETALALRPGDPVAAQGLAEVNGMLDELARIQELEDSYNEAIRAAEAAMDARNYHEAREAFTAALGIKAGEPYPSGKISEIDAILAEQARLQSIEQEYARAISEADSLMQIQEFEASIAAWEKASGIKPGEAYPAEKIAVINEILEEIARQQALDERYAQTIAAADDLLDRSSYLEALNEYQAARELKPLEPYPAEKISEINQKLAVLEEERDKAFNAAIAQADSYFDMGNYRNAKSAYQTALDIKPSDQHARARLDEVTVLYMAELESLKSEYRKVIADADNYFNEKIYDGAIENYRIAAGILPDEEYPGKMIRRITQIINDNAITDVNTLAQVIPDNTDRKFSFDPLPVSVRKENYILIKAKNVTDHDFKMLVNFGRDGSKTGGVVLQVPEGDAVRDYIIRIGGLYRWFSEDNNWLSIYPEGGDIEVALIRISKSD
jgi:tetratricopeptide (TPR) repeat protein